MPIADYFSPDYQNARERFCAAAERAGAHLNRYLLPERFGPQGESLSIDVARLGPESSTDALVVLSGTHGVEGLGGAGCQVGFLIDRLYEALPSSACALLVHAVNPHGFAWLRRVNEDNVDLNRNFIDFSQPPSSAAYEPLHEWLVPTDWEGDARALGPTAYGEPILIPCARGDLARARAWFGCEVRSLVAEESVNITGEKSVSAELEGTLARGFQVALPEHEITFIGLEFGTRPVSDVLTALRADHCVHARAPRDAVRSAAAQRLMRAAFYCETPAWQAAVYGRTADFVFRTCRALAQPA